MPYIIGTAGHIDHGKTSLIKALTGKDTDRLKEEKERGISIDLGFAHLALPDGSEAGIVDVPGHERFIRNMLAGAHGIDLVLFTVAADDGASCRRPRSTWTSSISWGCERPCSSSPRWTWSPRHGYGRSRRRSRS